MLYSALKLLGAKSGQWGAEMRREISPNTSEISQDRKDLHPIESIPKGFLANGVHRIHGEHVLDLITSAEVAGGKGWSAGCRDAMEIPPNVGISPQGDISIHQGVSSGAISGQRSIQNPSRICY